jgi:uncharacterized protein (TIGR02217 family)
MSFFESPRFPNYLAFGLEVAPMFATDIVRVNSGFESSNQRWQQALRTYDGSTTHRTAAQKAEIEAFFAAMRGRMHGFRLKDIADYRHNDAGGAGVVYLVTGSTYQLAKLYTSGAQTYRRDIRKPVVASVSIAGGGTYSAIDPVTGRFTHDAGGAPTGWEGEFDVPVRFDHDTLAFEVAARSQAALVFLANELRLVEIRT